MSFASQRQFERAESVLVLKLLIRIQVFAVVPDEVLANGELKCIHSY